MQVAKVGGTTQNIKIGGEDVPVAHDIRVTVKKNKLSQPFRKAQFTLYYDGSKSDPIRDLAELSMLRGIIPRFKADGTPDPKGRNFKIEAEDEVLFAKNREQVVEQLATLPKVQEKLLSILTNPEYIETAEQEIDEYEGMSEDEFENSLEYGESEAEETSWEDV